MLEALADFWLSEYLRRSLFAYPIVNALHIVSLGVVVTSAALMDVRVLGLGRRIPVADVIFYLRPVTIGAVASAIVTGFLLFAVQPLTYAANPVFLTKFALLTLALLNASVFVLQRRHLRPDAGMSRAMAVASICLWLGVVMAGRSIAFFD